MSKLGPWAHYRRRQRTRAAINAIMVTVIALACTALFGAVFYTSLIAVLSNGPYF